MVVAWLVVTLNGHVLQLAWKAIITLCSHSWLMKIWNTPPGKPALPAIAIVEMEEQIEEKEELEYHLQTWDQLQRWSLQFSPFMSFKILLSKKCTWKPSGSCSPNIESKGHVWSKGWTRLAMEIHCSELVQESCIVLWQPLAPSSATVFIMKLHCHHPTSCL